MGSWFYEGKYSVQFTVDNVTKDSWTDWHLIPEKKPVMQAPDLGLRLFKRFEFSQTYIIEDNDEVDNIIDDIIEYLHGKTGSITVGENTYTALFNVADISAEDHYTTFKLQAILSDFDPEDPDNTLDFGDFNTWTDWHLIPDETLKIVPPQLKEKYVDIPGRNGAIDLCNAVVGLPRFERMTGSLSFTIYDDDPETIYNDMLDNLHGHKFDEVEIMGKSYDGRWVIESYEPDGEEPKITLGYNLILHDWTFNEDPDTSSKDYYAYVKSVSEDAAKTAEVIAAEELLETELDETTDILASVTVNSGYDGALFSLRNTTLADIDLLYVGSDNIVAEYNGHQHEPDEYSQRRTYVGVSAADIETAEGTLVEETGNWSHSGVKTIFVPALPGKLVRLRKLKTAQAPTVYNVSKQIHVTDFLCTSAGVLWTAQGRNMRKLNDCPSLLMMSTWGSGTAWTGSESIAIRHEGLYYEHPQNSCTDSNVGSQVYSVVYKGQRYFVCPNGHSGSFQSGIPNNYGNSYQHWYYGHWYTNTNAQFIIDFLKFCEFLGLLDTLKVLTEQWVRRNITGGGSA